MEELTNTTENLQTLLCIRIITDMRDRRSRRIMSESLSVSRDIIIHFEEFGDLVHQEALIPVRFNSKSHIYARVSERNE